MESIIIQSVIKNKIDIAPSDKDTILTLTLSDAETITHAVRIYYCKEDIIDFFSDNNDYLNAAIDDANVMNALLKSYVEYRDFADGGEYEESMHWKQCLEKAVEDNKKILEKYLKK